MQDSKLRGVLAEAKEALFDALKVYESKVIEQEQMVFQQEEELQRLNELVSILRDKVIASKSMIAVLHDEIEELGIESRLLLKGNLDQLG